MTLRMIHGGKIVPTDLPGGAQIHESQIKGMGLADYVWPDGAGHLHVKKRAVVIAHGNLQGGIQPGVPPWTASVRVGESDHLSQLVLNPVSYVIDPTRDQSFMVLCEVYTPEGQVAPTNTRAMLRAMHAKAGAAELDRDDGKFTRWGFKQRYRIVPPHFDAEADGPDIEMPGTVFQAAERFLGACLDAGIMLQSSQMDNPNGWWSFKIGERGFPPSLEEGVANSVLTADHLLYARAFLEKVMREYGLAVQYAGVTCYFSTVEMREGDHRPAHAAVGKLADQSLSARVCWTVAAPGTRIAIEGFPAKADPYLTACKIMSGLVLERNEPT